MNAHVDKIVETRIEKIYEEIEAKVVYINGEKIGDALQKSYFDFSNGLKSAMLEIV